jgi:hypothetical protein
MALDRLPMCVLSKLRIVSRKWKEFLSSLDALQRIYSNLSVHSFLGFLVWLESAREGVNKIFRMDRVDGDEWIPRERHKYSIIILNWQALLSIGKTVWL